MTAQGDCAACHMPLTSTGPHIQHDRLQVSSDDDHSHGVKYAQSHERSCWSTPTRTVWATVRCLGIVFCRQGVVPDFGFQTDHVGWPDTDDDFRKQLHQRTMFEINTSFTWQRCDKGHNVHQARQAYNGKVLSATCQLYQSCMNT